MTFSSSAPALQMTSYFSSSNIALFTSAVILSIFHLCSRVTAWYCNASDITSNVYMAEDSDGSSANLVPKMKSCHRNVKWGCHFFGTGCQPFLDPRDRKCAKLKNFNVLTIPEQARAGPL